MEKLDVVVIGAGPAGLNCAEFLAKAGKKVIVLEKNNEIGPKVCAGGITRYNMDYLKLPDEVIGRSFDQIKMHTPFNSIKLKIDGPIMYTVDRKDLAEWHLKRLARMNVEIRTGSRVSKIEKDHVIYNGSKKIHFDHLVGADGSNSIVRKYLKLGTECIGYSYHYILPSGKFEDVEIYLDNKLFRSWYAWIFPHRDFVSIGSGCNPKVLPLKTAKMNFHTFLKEKGIDVSEGKFQMQMINHDFRGFKFGNVFLIGDAAGLASSLTGEGIYQAQVSGEEIARSIVDRDHVPSALNQLIHSLQFHNYCRVIIEQVGPFRIIGHEMIVTVIRRMVGKGPFTRFYP